MINSDGVLRIPRLSTVLVFGLVLSLFSYCLPQYRIFPQLAIETAIFCLLIIFLCLIQVAASKKIGMPILFFGFLLFFVNLLAQIVSPFEPTPQFFKISAFALCFVFITQYFVINNSTLYSSFKAHILLALILVIYGSYIYIVGDVEGTQTTEVGWKTIGRYWGFRYTAATRNDDIVYIIPSCLIALSYALFCMSKRKKSLYFILFFIFLIVTALSFSRGHILALFLTVFTVLFLKVQFVDRSSSDTGQHKISFVGLAKVLVGVLGILAFIILLLFIISIFIPEFNLLLNLWLKILSIVDPTAQDEVLGISSSNSARINIYFIGLDILTKYPLGVGAENFQFASMAEDHGQFWGENTYLEYLIDWGILGILILVPLFIYPVLKLYYIFRAHQRFLDMAYFAIALYLAIACIFNVLIGNFYVYILLSMIHAYIICCKRYSAKRIYNI